MANKFKSGDIVQLNSGGPPMTVSRTTEYGVECDWFKGASSEHGRFQEHSLKIYEPPQKA